MKPISSLASRAGLLLSSVIALYSAPSLAVDGTHVNAYVVTAQWRAGMINWGPACPDCWSGWAGNIELVTVRNGSVTRVDTVWKRSQGLGQYPTFDADAKRIAFYRWSRATVGTNSTTVNNGVNSVAVMNRDGSNVRNLVSLRAAPFGDMALNWPAGDWIYYINPKTGSSDDARQSNEIRRVNVNTLADELVWQQSGTALWFRRFETTMDGTHAGFQTYGGGANGDWNGVCAFPSMSGMTHFDGCNASVSASGTYGSNYFAGNHTEISINKIKVASDFLWVPLYDKTADQADWNQLYPNRGSINDFLGRTVFNNSMGSECMRWAANSDKWILEQAFYHGLDSDEGGNCVAVNWVDLAAFMCSNNPKLPSDPAQIGTIYRGNSTGDMWVDGGAQNLGKWEDTTGVWHAVPGFVPTGVSESSRISNNHPALSIAGAGSGIRIMLPAGRTFMARVVDAQGRTIIQKRVTGETVLHDQRLHAGVYQVVLESGNQMYGSTLTLAQ